MKEIGGNNSGLRDQESNHLDEAVDDYEDGPTMRMSTATIHFNVCVKDYLSLEEALSALDEKIMEATYGLDAIVTQVHTTTFGEHVITTAVFAFYEEINFEDEEEDMVIPPQDRRYDA